MSSLFRSRTAAVVAGAVVLVGLGSAGGAYAAGQLDSSDIKNNSIRGVDVQNGSVAWKDLNGVTQRNFDSKASDTEVNGIKHRVEDLESGLKLAAATLAAPMAIDNIGGSINDRNTKLNTGLELPAGEYLVTVDGAFMSETAAADSTVDVYPQLSLWLDKNHDGDFQWQAAEGDISPNALMPTAANRHIAVSGSSVVTLTEKTYVGLLGFGYASDTSSKRSGEIDVIGATITATPIS